MASDIFTTLTGFMCAARQCGLALLAAVSVATWAVPAQAQIARSWNTGDGDWSVGTNWLPIGAPGSLDGAFIGNLSGVENATVTLDQRDTIAGLQITDGMVLTDLGNGHSLTVNGNTLVSGSNFTSSFFHSELIVPTGGLTTNDLTVEDDAELTTPHGSVLNVSGTLSIDESSELGVPSVIATPAVATINLSKASGRALINDGTIKSSSEGRVINQLSNGLIDLDGNNGNGKVALTLVNLLPTPNVSKLTINGTSLSDSFSGSMDLLSGAQLNMNLTNGWTADSSSSILVYSAIGSPSPTTEINGTTVDLGGELQIKGSSGEDVLLQLNSDVTFANTAEVETLLNGDLETTGDAVIQGGSFMIREGTNVDFNGTTTVNGGTFTTAEDGNIDFNGPTTVSGGTFNTHSISIADGDVDFNGLTTYSGNVTINGVAQQQGNATVSAMSVITADAFDMDGSTGITIWDVNAPLVVNAKRIDTGVSTFDGTFDIGGPTSARMEVNLIDPQASWQMAGTMNLGGVSIGFANRVAGSKMMVSGQLNVQQRVDISADTTLSAASTTDIVASAHVLRMSGTTVVESGAAITGDGTLQNAASGDMLLPVGLSTGNVGLVNLGLLRLGEAVGVISVEEFAQTAGATLVVDVGRNTTGTDADVLSTSSGAAVVAGFVQPNIVNIGGTFQAPQIGDTFTFLTAVGGVIDTFDDVLDSNLGGQVFEWALIHNSNNVQIELTDIGGLPGDYNRNGVVDAPDYVLWRKLFGSQTNLAADGDLSGTVDEADYDFWRARFGDTLGTGSAAAVPEAGTSLLLCIGAVPLVACRWRHVVLT